MATVFPVDAVAGAPEYAGQDLRQVLASLVGGATAARPLGGRSGVRPGPASVVSVSGGSWTVNPHNGVLDLQPSVQASVYLYSEETSANTGTITAAHATYARTDIVYVTLDDPAEADGSSVPAVTFGYDDGTASASPAAPTPPARSMVLAEINVPNVAGGGASSATVSPVFPRATAVGGIFPFRTTTEMTAALGLGSSDTGVFGDLDGSLLRSNGTTWKPYVQKAADWTSIASALGAVFVMGTGFTWRINQQADMVVIEPTRIARASTNLTMATNTDYTLISAGGIPAALRPLNDTDESGFVRTSGGIVPVRFTICADGSVLMMATSGVTLSVYNAANQYASIPAFRYAVA